MTWEATLRDTKILSSKRYTCATATGIPKGTLLCLSADQTASIATEASIFVGVAHADVNKSTDTAFNTETSVTADKGAVYEMVSSGSIGLGKWVKCAGYNKVVVATTADVGSAAKIIVGMALDAGSDGEVINVEVFA